MPVVAEILLVHASDLDLAGIANAFAVLVVERKVAVSETGVGPAIY